MSKEFEKDLDIRKENKGDRVLIIHKPTGKRLVSYSFGSQEKNKEKGIETMKRIIDREKGKE